VLRGKTMLTIALGPLDKEIKIEYNIEKW